MLILTPNRSQPRHLLGVHAAHAWHWAWINTGSGIYRHRDARCWGSTQQEKYRPEWLARVEGDREAGNRRWLD